MEKSYIIIDKWRCIFLLFIDFSISRFIEFFTLDGGQFLEHSRYTGTVLIN